MKTHERLQQDGRYHCSPHGTVSNKLTLIIRNLNPPFYFKNSNMKSQLYKPMLFLVSFMFLAATCAKESDEQYDEEESYHDAMYGKGSPLEIKKMAAADWPSYINNSNKLIAIAEANLNTIRVRIENGDYKPGSDLASFHTTSVKKLTILKYQLSKEQEVFASGPDKLTEAVIDNNKKFKRTFREQLLELNTSLDEAVEGGSEINE